MSKKIIGTCKCIVPGCTEIVHVLEAENETLSYRCIPCDWAPYFKAGTDANRALRRVTTMKAQPVPPAPAAKPTAQPKAAPVPAPAPAPAPVRRNTVFG